MLQNLVGQVVTRIVGMEADSREVTFYAGDRALLTLHHVQDCCESVYLDDVAGDPADLIGTPILVAEEATNIEEPADYFTGYVPESYTWTFYRFATGKGWVVLRWLGESNGYYSEQVDVHWHDEDDSR